MHGGKERGEWQGGGGCHAGKERCGEDQELGMVESRGVARRRRWVRLKGDGWQGPGDWHGGKERAGEEEEVEF